MVMMPSPSQLAWLHRYHAPMSLPVTVYLYVPGWMSLPTRYIVVPESACAAGARIRPIAAAMVTDPANSLSIVFPSVARTSTHYGKGRLSVSECQIKLGQDGNMCGRKVTGRGMCSSHYRRWIAGEPLDTPIRGYQRYEEGPDGVPIRASGAPSPKSKAFAAEMTLMNELGLR